MPKSTEREISTQTEYISSNGKIYKKVTTYSIVGNAKWVQDDNITINEAKDIIGLGKEKDPKQGSKDGYISETY